MSLHSTLLVDVKNAIKELFSAEVSDSQIQLQKTKKEFEGNITLVVFPFLKITKMGPEQSGEAIGKWLQDNTEWLIGFNVVKGFLNLELKHDLWLTNFNVILATENYGFASQPSGKTYMVEYSSPNTNKPLHLGHLRNIFLGYSVANILKASGHEVIKTQIINDRGIHICKSMLAWQKYGEGETPESTGIKGDHLIGKYYVRFDKEYKKEIAALIEGGASQEDAERNAPIMNEARELLLKWEAKEPNTYKLWETMNSWVYEGFDATYKMMGVDFDSLYYESDTYILGKDVVDSGLEKGHFYRKDDNSVWCDLSAYKLDDKLVLRSDGTSVYMTQDIGTAIERFKDYPALSGLIYTVGNEQNHHFKVLFSILQKLGMPWADECYHLSYGMVELPEGKMKSREGTVVDADDLMATIVNDARESAEERGHIGAMSDKEKEDLFKTIGLGGLKYFLLKVDPKSKMMFDPKESIDLNGNTGPFIQYAHARIKSVLRNVDEMNSAVDTSISLQPIEVELIQQMLDYPEVIERAGKEYTPAIIANYIYDTVKMFNSFYQTVSILKEEDDSTRNFRLNLSQQVGTMVSSAMGLLGVNVPERM